MTLAPDKLGPEWKKIEWVLTDVDDTLTWNGTLPPETLIALANLRKAGIKVVAVTGACAGWCDQIAQLWPVDAVLGENGAFILRKQEGYLTLTCTQDFDQMRKVQGELKAKILEVLKDYPDLNLTLDQSYRLCEVAIDIGQNRPKVDASIIDELVSRIKVKTGANATASSIHINVWHGEHSKKATTLSFLKEQGLNDTDIDSLCCYVGDSVNDQAMFATLSKSVGVANIAHYWDKLTAFPTVVMTEAGGLGFAEFSEKLLRLKNSS